MRTEVEAEYQLFDELRMTRNAEISEEINNLP